MNRIRWPVFFFMLSLLFVPRVALAEGLTDSFVSGLNAFAGNGVNEQVTPERDFIESYESLETNDIVLTETQLREYDENSSTIDYVNGTLDSFNTVPFTGGSASLIYAVRTYFGNNSASSFGRNLILTAIGICFLWWGVRKSVRMIFSAFRKGSASV